jgi:hypothetical protein
VRCPLWGLWTGDQRGDGLGTIKSVASNDASTR